MFQNKMIHQVSNVASSEYCLEMFLTYKFEFNPSFLFIFQYSTYFLTSFLFSY